jgi:hypothetical protein
VSFGDGERLAVLRVGQTARIVMVRRLYCVVERIQWTRARTTTASGRGELHLDHLIGPVVDGRSPTDTPLSLGADRLLVFPIDDEPSCIKALISVGLPLDIETPGTNHFNPVLLLQARPEWGP